MTNGELACIVEKMGEQVFIILRHCDCDKSKIDDGLWSKLCQYFREIEDYV